MWRTVSDFDEFFVAKRDTVFRVVLVAFGDRATAEDAVAEAFARAYSRWSAINSREDPTAWVIRTALNVSMSWWRHRRHELLTDDLDTSQQTTVPAPSEPIDGALIAAVASLPRRQREVIALRIIADLPAEATGLMLGIKPATVHVHLHRALDSIRRSLTEQLPADDGSPVRSDHAHR
jgi:RNA polymerase sigma factor (sigma-70 family)